MSQGPRHPDAGAGRANHGTSATNPSVSPSNVNPGSGESQPIVIQADLRPGQILFDGYRLIDQIGEGGMGTVWLVTHVEFDTKRALKLIIPKNTGTGDAFDHEARERFRREARIMAKLEGHPNAVKVYHAKIGPNAAYIEMEYIEGQSLNHWIRRGEPMPLEWTAYLLDQLCSVLDLAHLHGFIHRDIKPSNLMILKDSAPAYPKLKVLDFGIAKVLEANEDLSLALTNENFLGTPHYASPEQCDPRAIAAPDGKSAINARSDLYSVGVVLYELLTGERPFQGNAPMQVYAHLHTEPPPFAERNPKASVPPAVEQLVLRTLSKEPAKRPQSARALRDEFFHATGLGPRAPRRGTPPGPVPAVDRTMRASHAMPLPSPETPLPSTNPHSELVQETYYGEETSQGVDRTVVPADDPGSATRDRRSSGLAPPPSRPALPQQPAWVQPQAPASQPGGFDPSRGMQAAQPSGTSRLLKGAVAVLVVAVLGVGAVIVGGKWLAPPDPTPETKKDRSKPAGETGTKPVPVDRMNESLLAWNEQGFEPESLSTAPGEWPLVLIQRETKFRFAWDERGKHYLPEGARGLDDRAEDGWPKVLTNRHGLVFHRIEGGEFLMGSGDLTCAGPPHRVRLSGFYLQKTEVTNGQVTEFFKQSPALKLETQWKTGLEKIKELRALSFKKDPAADPAMLYPAIGVTCTTAEAFALWAGGNLPTEAQWEFAARSRGLDIRYPWGWRQPPTDALERNLERVNLDGNNPLAELEVAEPDAKADAGDITAQGILNLCGNVQEWCRDLWGAYPTGGGATVRDPSNRKPYPRESDEPAQAPCVNPDGDAPHRVVRGGSWGIKPEDVDMRRRWHRDPATGKQTDLGFRLVIECPADRVASDLAPASPR